MKDFIVFIFFLLLVAYLYNKSKKKSNFENSPSAMIFYAPWCGHCQHSMGDFKNATEQSNGKIQMVNSDDPQNKELLQKYNVKGFPTIKSTNGEDYTGPRTASGILNFAQNK